VSIEDGIKGKTINFVLYNLKNHKILFKLYNLNEDKFEKIEGGGEAWRVRK